MNQFCAITLENKYFKTSQTCMGMFLKHAIDFTAEFYFLWTVDMWNKKEEYGELGL